MSAPNGWTSLIEAVYSVMVGNGAQPVQLGRASAPGRILHAAIDIGKSKPRDRVPRQKTGSKVSIYPGLHQPPVYSKSCEIVPIGQPLAPTVRKYRADSKSLC